MSLPKQKVQYLKLPTRMLSDGLQRLPSAVTALLIKTYIMNQDISQ